VDWPELHLLRPAAQATRARRRTNAIAAIVSTLKVSLAGVLLARSNPGLSDAMASAAFCRYISRIRTCQFIQHHPHLLISQWHFTPDFADDLITSLTQVLHQHPFIQHLPAATRPPHSQGGYSTVFPHRLTCFFASLAAGWPPFGALLLWEQQLAGTFSPDGRCFKVDTTSGRPNEHGFYSDASLWIIPGDGHRTALRITTSQDSIVLIQSLRTMSTPRAAPQANPPLSAFLPDYIRLPRDATGRVILPSHNVSSIVERRKHWFIKLGDIEAEVAAIVSGYLQMPRLHNETLGIARRNHPSWENNPEAKAALGPVTASWLYGGILEYVSPRLPPPREIVPVGAVDKSSFPWHRQILDGRPVNQCFLPWPVRFIGVSSLGTFYTDKMICWSIDIQDAYHVAPYGGCFGGLHKTRRFRPAASGGWEWARAYVVGCTPENCLGTCDKAMVGICLDGHMFRFAAPQFGLSTAGSPLNAIFQPIRRRLAREGIASLLWVDDLKMGIHVPPHGSCGGIEAACPFCLTSLEHAHRMQTFSHDLIACLGLHRNLAKDEPPSQSGPFTGVNIDSVHGTISIVPKKLAKLTEGILEVLSVSRISSRALAAARGRIQYYKCCIKHIIVFAVEFSVAIGTDAEIDWDRPVPVSDHLQSMCARLLTTIPRYAPEGQPLWPPVPSSVYGRFLRGDTEGVTVITYDASFLGWGAILRTSADEVGELIVGTLAEDLEQVQREGEAGAQALASAVQSNLLSAGDFVLLRNDCTGALTALSKGSFKSPVLQAQALRVQELCSDMCINPLFLHAPGRVMIEEGVDAASRDLAERIRGPACSPALSRIIQSAAAALGWTLSLDVFASSANAQTPRFFSLYAEPHAEKVDAFNVPDWNRSICPHCGKLHREVLLLFPPRACINSCVAKARADGIRGIFVVPHQPSAPFWGQLERAASGCVPAQVITHRRAANLTTHHSGSPIHNIAVVAVDFDPDAPALAAPCGQEGLRRQPDPYVAPRDLHDRLRIQRELASVRPH
jgi:hypothetical protein